MWVKAYWNKCLVSWISLKNEITQLFMQPFKQGKDNCPSIHYYLRNPSKCRKTPSHLTLFKNFVLRK